MERLPEFILRRITLSNPALFYSSLTSPLSTRRIEAFKHQFQTLCHAMVSRPVRILIADEIGLGKTIQALAIARYLELRGEAKKILILVPKVLREQWKQEIRRVGGKPVVITSGNEVEGILLRRTTFDSNADYFVVSIDLAKSQNHAEKFSAIDWDLLIVDEVHNVTYNTQRYDFLKNLIEKSKEDLNIIFLSATPHRGNPKDYIERLRLLDSTLTADWNDLDSERFYKKTHGVLVFRRTKKIVNELEKKEIFKKCDFNAVIVDITEEERRFFEELDEVLFEMVKDVYMNSPVALLAVLLRKRAASSYESALKTINNIIKNQYSGSSDEDILEDQIKQIFGLGYDEMELEENSEIDDLISSIINSVVRKYRPDTGQINALKRILEIGKSIGRNDSKLKNLAEVLAYHLERNEKVIVFTEFKDTLEYLRNNLPPLLKQEHGIHLSEEEDISVIHGGMKSEEIENQVEKFSKDGKLLISTDVASEGLNLQVANILINYEIPWSPIKLEQRVGRIWRLNQTKETIAYTLLLNHEVDLQILESLYQKILNITDAVGSGPNVGKPVFGTRTLSGNFEYQLENVQDEENLDFPVSEFDLIFSAIKKKSLDEQTKRIINTLKSLRTRIEEVVPLNTCEEIQEELNSVLLPDDMGSEIVFEKLKKYISAFENSFIDNIASYLHRILTNRIHELLLSEKCLKIFVKDESKEYRLFQVEIVDQGKKIYEYPVLIEIDGKGSARLYRGISILEKLADAFSKERFVIEVNQKEKMDIQTGKLIEQSARNLRSIMNKHTSYDIELSESSMKTGSLFRELNTKSTEILRVEGVPDREFSVFKLLHPSILEILGLSPDSFELPSTDYERLMERSFVPLEDLLESERKAMEIVMDIERKRLVEKYGGTADWKVEDVSLKEHYDVKVSEPEGEKYIEVKGHKPLWLFAELTEAELRFAKDNQDKYWIYIVSNFGGEKPVILKIFNPFDDDRRKIYVVRGNEDIDVTEKLELTLEKKKRYIISFGRKKFS